MPIYEYECQKCKDRFEPVVPVEEDPEADVRRRRREVGLLLLRRHLLQHRLRALSRCGRRPHFPVAKMTRIGYKARTPQSPPGEPRENGSDAASRGRQSSGVS